MAAGDKDGMHKAYRQLHDRLPPDERAHAVVYEQLHNQVAQMKFFSLN